MNPQQALALGLTGTQVSAKDIARLLPVLAEAINGEERAVVVTALLFLYLLMHVSSNNLQGEAESLEQAHERVHLFIEEGSALLANLVKVIYTPVAVVN